MLLNRRGDEPTLEDLFNKLEKIFLVSKEDDRSPAVSYLLGVMYEEGLGTMIDHVRARSCYEQAGNKGFPQAWTRLGLLYLDESNHKEALQLFTRAHENHDVIATLNIGIIYANGGRGIEKNIAKAHWYFEQAGNKQNVLALKHNAQLYKAENNYFQVIELHKAAADLGDAEALFELGKYYELGGIPNVQVDNLTALNYYNDAASRRHSEARKKIITMCLDGRAQAADIKFALGLMEKFLQHGNAAEIAQIKPRFAEVANSYGQILQFGQNGVKIDIYQAIRYYKKSHELGNTYAAYALGCIYQSGADPSKKEADIISHLLRGRSGNLDANTRLMKIWKAQAFNSNNAEAHFRLGECYEQGEQPAPQNNLIALKHYTNANLSYPPHPEARKKIIAMCLDGRATAIGPRYALDLMEQILQSGTATEIAQLKSHFAEAASSYGQMLQFGTYEIKVDINQAITYYKKSDEHGGSYAPYALGYIYQSRIQYPSKDEMDIVIDCYLRARQRGYGEANKLLMEIWNTRASKNDAEAHFRLGECYELGLTYAQSNNGTALNHYQAAANGLHLEAREKIIAMCLDGRAERASIAYALDLMEGLLQRGTEEEIAKIKPRFAALASSYGKQLQFGTHGMKIAISQALYYYRKADDYGDSYAPFAIGNICQSGVDASKGMDAYAYYERAHQRGNGLAESCMKSIREKIAEREKHTEFQLLAETRSKEIDKAPKKTSNPTVLTFANGKTIPLPFKKQAVTVVQTDVKSTHTTNPGKKIKLTLKKAQITQPEQEINLRKTPNSGEIYTVTNKKIRLLISETENQKGGMPT
jgi:TPR repeat protein